MASFIVAVLTNRPMNITQCLFLFPSFTHQSAASVSGGIGGGGGVNVPCLLLFLPFIVPLTVFDWWKSLCSGEKKSKKGKKKLNG